MYVQPTIYYIDRVCFTLSVRLPHPLRWTERKRLKLPKSTLKEANTRLKIRLISMRALFLGTSCTQILI